MKITVAQTRPVKGDIKTNIERHKKMIDLAITHGADMIIFPELSITGYEPELAKGLATDQDDNRFDDFQHISNTDQITIGVGVPTKSATGLCISMFIFQPHKARTTYSKKYIHPDEEPFFISGQNFGSLAGTNPIVSFAICYELSIAAHSENAHNYGAEIYIASVAKTAEGVEKAHKTLAEIAGKYSMTVLMSNCVGHCDNFESSGNTAIWNNTGKLAAQLNNSDEGLLIIDTATQYITERIL
jgi:predicted amidohydrolase